MIQIGRKDQILLLNCFSTKSFRKLSLKNKKINAFHPEYARRG